MYIDLSFKTLFIVWLVIMILSIPIHTLPIVLTSLLSIFLLFVLLLFIYILFIQPDLLVTLLDYIPQELKLFFSVLFLISMVFLIYKGFNKKIFISNIKREMSFPTFKKIISFFRK